MNSTNRDARVAGFLYLLSVIVGYFDLMYLPDAFLVPGNAGATAHNIATHELLFRIAMVADLVTGALWLLVVLALYRLLRRVDETQANLMVILGAFMQVPLYFVNVVNYVAALLLVRGEGYLSGLAIAQREVMAMLFLRLHHYETEASLVFAGLWLIPFGILVYKSGFLPRWLGVWLIVDCFAWLAISFTAFLAPQYAALVGNITTPITLGEVAMMLWLLIIGARPSIVSRRAAS